MNDINGIITNSDDVAFDEAQLATELFSNDEDTWSIERIDSSLSSPANKTNCTIDKTMNLDIDCSKKSKECERGREATFQRCKRQLAWPNVEVAKSQPGHGSNGYLPVKLTRF